jgi:mannose-6-phosphate isomerase
MTSSTLTSLAPFRLEPLFVERIWGFADLRPWYDHVATGDPIGEVWLTGDECVVLDGPFAGGTLADVFAKEPLAMVGLEAPTGASPLLLKILFAKDKLSVQVHPDDHMAQKYGEPRGKTECWYTLSAEPGAKVAVGLHPGVTLEQIEREVADGTLEQSLEAVPVAAGDLIFVDAGTVHAVWPGSVLLETQQYSDTTYRLFDYGRPRELHVAKAIEAIRLKTEAGKIAPVVLKDRTVLVSRDYFCVEKIDVDGARTGGTMVAAGEPSFGLAYLFASEGSGRITSLEQDGFEAIELQTRRIVAVPASSPAWQIEDLGGLELIRITPRWPRK